MKLRLPAFWQALLVIAAAYLVLRFAFPPVMPKALMIQYMIIVVIGVLLYFSFNDARWGEFLSPIQSTLRKKGMWPVRWLLLLGIPALAGFVVYDNLKPSFDAPVELRQVHPAPPSSLQVFDKTFDLKTLENPVRLKVLEELAGDREAAMETYNEAVAAGSQSYFENCFYCHGDLLDGNGPYARGFNPLPINFQDVGTIAQLQEAFLFWRIATGGPGLPKEGTPWNSAMPVWHEMLSEEEVWNLILFLFDYVGQVPRMWDTEMSATVTGIKDRLVQARAGLQGAELYQFRCAACHGEQGMGDGPAAERMVPRPRDFSLGMFKYKTTPGSLPPSDDDLFQTIKFGLDETGMPAWQSLLSDEQIKSLIPVVKRFDIAATWSPEDAPDEAFDDDGYYTGDDFTVIAEREPVDGQIPYAPESVERGREVFEKVCNECHGPAGRGNITSGVKLEDDWGYRIWPRNLTKPWTWRITDVVGTAEETRDATVRRIYERLSIGITGTPMPAHRAVEEGNEDPIPLEDRWHVANYVYSLRENAAPTPGGNAVLRGVKIDGDLPDDPESEAWLQAPLVTLRLVPNIIKEERLFTPLNDAISVRVLYNDSDIAFKLEVDDRTDSRPGEPVSMEIQDESLELYPDAFAIQLPQAEAFVAAPVVEKPLFRHGDAKHPTTIWYWNAGSLDPEVAPSAVLLEGNGPDAELKFREGSAPLSAAGAWQDGRWQVVMKRPLRPGGGDIAIEEGRFIPVSLANWDGSNGEIGSKHTLTTWYWLLLPPQLDPVRVYGMPAALAALLFLAGLLLVRRQRKLGDAGAAA